MRYAGLVCHYVGDRAVCRFGMSLYVGDPAVCRCEFSKEYIAP